HVRLVVILRAPGVAGDFLQADERGVFFLDDMPDSVEPIAMIDAADALVDVVSEESHRTSRPPPLRLTSPHENTIGTQLHVQAAYPAGLGKARTNSPFSHHNLVVSPLSFFLKCPLSRTEL